MYVVITGGSRGIGKALAYQFAGNGYDLILTCEKNKEMLYEVKNDIEHKYNRKVFIKVGLLDENDIDIFEKEANVDIKRNIYILINNAGKCDYNTIDKISDEKYKDLMYSNIDYTFNMTRFISKLLLKEKRGIVINITSMWGLLGSSCEVVYSMTKGAIVAFTKALAKEFKDSNIDVIAFALGAVKTDMCKGLASTEGIKAFIKTLDNGRMFYPSEIAEKIYGFVSTNNYKTGDIIEINNGLK